METLHSDVFRLVADSPRFNLLDGVDVAEADAIVDISSEM
jgi:hypothetical protein